MSGSAAAYLLFLGLRIFGKAEGEQKHQASWSGAQLGLKLLLKNKITFLVHLYLWSRIHICDTSGNTLVEIINSSSLSSGALFFNVFSSFCL